MKNANTDRCISPNSFFASAGINPCALAAFRHGVTCVVFRVYLVAALSEMPEEKCCLIRHYAFSCSGMNVVLLFGCYPMPERKRNFGKVLSNT